MASKALQIKGDLSYEVLPAESEEVIQNTRYIEQLNPDQYQDAKAIRQQDAETADWLIEISRSLVKHAKTFGSMVIAVQLTQNNIRERREILGLPYGAQPPSSGSKGSVFD